MYERHRHASIRRRVVPENARSADLQGFVLGYGVGLVGRRHRVIDRKNADRDPRRGTVPVGVRQSVLEHVDATPVRRRSVAERAVSVQRQVAARDAARDANRSPAIGCCIVRQDARCAHAQELVLVGLVAVFNCHDRGVGRSDRHRHLRLRGPASAVRDGVAEGVRTRPVRIRDVAHPSPVADRRPVPRHGHGDQGKRVSVWVPVVDEHRDVDWDVLVGLCEIIGRRRRGVPSHFEVVRLRLVPLAEVRGEARPGLVLAVLGGVIRTQGPERPEAPVGVRHDLAGSLVIDGVPVRRGHPDVDRAAGRPLLPVQVDVAPALVDVLVLHPAGRIRRPDRARQAGRSGKNQDEEEGRDSGKPCHPMAPESALGDSCLSLGRVRHSIDPSMECVLALPVPGASLCL